MVSVVLQSPEWFFGVDAALEGAAAIVAFLVFFAALRAFKLTKDRKYLAFSLCFGFISVAYAARAVTDIVLENIALSGTVFLVGYLTHIFTLLFAYLMLVILTFKISDFAVRALLYLLLLPPLLVSGSYFLSFYGLSAILLAFIALSYFRNCRRVCSVPSYLVFSAFVILTLAQVQFLLGVLSKLWYVSAHVSIFVGFLLILIALAMVHRK